MLAFLMVSVVTGLTFATVSLLGFGAGFWMVALWYVAGCWAGFGMAIAAFLIAGAKQNPTLPHWPDQPAIR